MIIMGIDPGQAGAIAFIEDGKVIALYDMPVSARVYGGGLEVNGGELASIIMSHRPDHAVIELVSARSMQGVASSFRFGESFGYPKGVMGALQIPFEGCLPNKWKKPLGLAGKDKDKDLSRTLAIQQHPEISDQLTRKKDVDRAEAIWIAKSIL
jgi:crossover junction endodeoxyribonuclease RuvC